MPSPIRSNSIIPYPLFKGNAKNPDTNVLHNTIVDCTSIPLSVVDLIGNYIGPTLRSSQQLEDLRNQMNRYQSKIVLLTSDIEDEDLELLKSFRVVGIDFSNCKKITVTGLMTLFEIPSINHFGFGFSETCLPLFQNFIKRNHNIQIGKQNVQTPWIRTFNRTPKKPNYNTPPPEEGGLLFRLPLMDFPVLP